MISIHALREEGDALKIWLTIARTNFYPRPLRGGRRQLRYFCAGEYGISIHALREEGDRNQPQRDRHTRISIHALREEGDQVQIRLALLCTNFYPRPPRGGRLIINSGYRTPE